MAGRGRSAGRRRAGRAGPGQVAFVEVRAKGIAVIESFSARHPGMTLSHIARRTGTTPAAARQSLRTPGDVGQRGKRFHQAPKEMIPGGASSSAARLDEVPGPEVPYMAHTSASRARRTTAVVGARYPAHATSLGRVLLAGLEDAALAAW